MIAGFKPFHELFLAYAGTFLSGDAEADAPFQLKIDHTLRVVAHSLQYTPDLPQTVRLSAALAALFHDLGRFSQFSEHGTFHDGSSCNHAQRSVEVLEKLRCLPPGLPHRAEIVDAIRLHNQKSLQEPLSLAGSFFYHLLRDCDKTDVLAVLRGHYQSADDRDRYLTLGLSDQPSISPEVLADLHSGRIVDIRHLHTVHDFKLLQIGWIYDIHFEPAYRFILSRQDFQAILATIPPRLLPTGFAALFATMQAREHSRKHPVLQTAVAAGLA